MTHLAPLEARLARRLRFAQPAMVDLLERLVACDAAAARDLLAVELDRAGLAVRRLPGGHLYARPRDRHGGVRQLVLGHLDSRLETVSAGAGVPRLEDGRLLGPGSVEGKGGLVVLVFALRAIAELGLEPSVTTVVLANADAEAGSPDSTRLIGLLAHGAARALVLKAADGADGRLKIARSAVGRFTIRSGDGPARLDELVDAVGGTATRDGSELLLRVPTADGVTRVEALVEALRLTGVEIEGGFLRPPLEPVARNHLLLGSAIRLGRTIGLVVADAGSDGGDSDASTTSPFTATLDGLGPVGGGAGTESEHVLLSSLPERAALLALLLLEPPSVPERRRLRPARRRGRVAVIGSPLNDANVDLVSAWQALGLDARLTDPDDVRPADVVLGRLDVLPTLDGVEPGLLDLLRLELRGSCVLNGAAAIVRAHDKLLTARALARAGVPHPRTVHLLPAHLRPGGHGVALAPPLVVKPRFGSWGVDVFRCDTLDEVEACLAEIRGRLWFRRRGAVVQELVPPVGHDVRLVVAAGRIIGGVERVAAPGEWRTNMCLGGSDRPPPRRRRRSASRSRQRPRSAAISSASTCCRWTAVTRSLR